MGEEEGNSETCRAAEGSGDQRFLSSGKRHEGK